MVNEYFRPATLEQALEAQAAGGTVAAGGTFLLAGSLRGDALKIGRLVDLGGLLPRDINREGKLLTVGAGATFQELADSAACPPQLRAAALTMANRNTRNRATVGGNLGANKSCASLVPLFLALGAAVEYREAAGPARELPLSAWLAEPKGIILRVTMALEPGALAAVGRSSRTACDVATATVAVACRMEGGAPRGLKIALGGFGPHASLQPALELLFEGKPLPGKAAIEAAAIPLLPAIADKRGSAAYKRRIGAALLADALHAAKELI